MIKLSKYQHDVLERVLWTAAEAAVAVLAVHVSDLDPLWVAPAAAALALLKSLVAKHIGDSTAALPIWATDAVTGATVAVVEEVVTAKKAVAKKAAKKAEK